ncbi:argininosuccinate synthase [Amycolatopsis sp. NBRC 101858]|uniref:argininosuccinate synthase domain-containing protein n=1 Tax=Amycolatopsis sp. NBRC 101858 TaxID=3032200 RepID=UPI0024A56AC4|nr:argininosuccinate synthase domain-containing protein [Amycolatopsis sp. NBRC 101858]GLY38694.1 argininosuccinate synthase [Amycolatopsis sp. NBRC 101858]
MTGLVLADIFPAEGEFLAPEEVVVTFDRGVPVAIDGETVSVAEARLMLSARGEAQGIGRGGTLALATAYRALEQDTVSGEVHLVLYAGRVSARPRPTEEHNEEKREQ